MAFAAVQDHVDKALYKTQAQKLLVSEHLPPRLCLWFKGKDL